VLSVVVGAGVPPSPAPVSALPEAVGPLGAGWSVGAGAPSCTTMTFVFAAPAGLAADFMPPVGTISILLMTLLTPAVCRAVDSAKPFCCGFCAVPVRRAAPDALTTAVTREPVIWALLWMALLTASATAVCDPVAPPAPALVLFVDGMPVVLVTVFVGPGTTVVVAAPGATAGGVTFVVVFTWAGGVLS